jgi:hypothetical protein
MRILIIAGTRVGGTSFGDWLSLELGIPFIMEPDSINNSNNWINGKCVTKIIYSKDCDKHINKSWDKIIGITRTNTYECAISNIWFKDFKSGHKKYIIKEGWIEQNKSRIYDEIKIIDNMHLCITNLPIFQITYENIFEKKVDIDRIANYVGLKELYYLNYLDSSNKLRDNKNTKLI